MPQVPLHPGSLESPQFHRSRPTRGAQKQLAIIAGYWQQPDILQKMSDATADKEIKALIEQRLNDLKAQQAEKEITNLPPISLRVSNATLLNSSPPSTTP